MTTKLIFLFLFVIAVISPVSGKTTIRYIDALKVKYIGDGALVVGPSDVGDFTYRIEITGLASYTNADFTVEDQLIITPTSQSANSIFVNSIIADGAMKKIKVTFPPGKDGRASCVRNIYVSGYVNNITIIGGDLGAPVGRDGQVQISGPVKKIFVKGKKNKIKNTKNAEWWGGNIWADIDAKHGVSKIMSKGGHIYYTPLTKANGAISIGGNAKLIAADGMVVKTSETVRVMFGGGIKADIFADGYEIKQIRAKGGLISGGGIYARQIKKINIKGQKALDPRPEFSVLDQGIFKTLVQTTDSNYNYKDCSLKKIIVNNGLIKDSIFVAKGNMNSVKVVLENPLLGPAMSNSIIRMGYDGDVTDNTPPDISPETLTTGILTEARLVVPFTVSSTDSNEILTVSVHNRGPALDAVISNNSGQVFYPGEQWTITNYPAIGMFVWVPKDYQENCYSNIVVRVTDDGIPNEYDDLNIIACVTSSNVAPQITLDPPDNPRIFNEMNETNLFWNVSVYDMNIYDTITFSIENDSLGLDFSNITDRSYYVYATNQVVGVYSNIIFKATDDEGLHDSEKITVYITSNSEPVVASSLPGNQVTWATSNKLDFFIIAYDIDTNTLTFTVPSNLPSGATYTQSVHQSVISASNLFSWTPGFSQAGTYDLVFSVYDSQIPSLTGEVSVTLTITNNLSGLYTDENNENAYDKIINATTASYPGDIGKINLNSSVYDSQFIAGVKDAIPRDWQNASYLGRVKNIKIQGTAVSNLFISLKKISIWQGDVFDFSSNDVWVDGELATDNSQ